MRTLASLCVALLAGGCSCSCDAPLPAAVMADGPTSAASALQVRAPESPPAHPPAPPAEVVDLSSRGVPCEMLVPPYATLTEQKTDDGRIVVELRKEPLVLELFDGPGVSLEKWSESALVGGAQVRRREVHADTWEVVVSRDEQTSSYAVSRGGLICQSMSVDKNLLKQVEKLCGTVRRVSAARKNP